MEGTLASGGMRMLGAWLPGPMKEQLSSTICSHNALYSLCSSTFSAQLKYLRPLNNLSGNQANPKLTAPQRQ